MTEQIRRQRKETERMGIVIEHMERGREQAGMSREGRRTMEKVLENTVRDNNQVSPATGCEKKKRISPEQGLRTLI